MQAWLPCCRSFLVESSDERRTGSEFSGGGNAVSVAVHGRRVESKNVYRFGFFVLAVAIGVTTLSARMLYMQVLQGQKTNPGGDTQPTATVTVPSTRGLIFDASGAPLVRNVIAYAVTVTPIDLPLDSKQDVAAKLGSLLKLDPIYIVTQIDSAPGSLYEPVKICLLYTSPSPR